MTARTVPKRRVTARIRRFRGVLMVAGPMETFELTDSAEFVFRAVDGARTVAEIGELVAETYGVSLAEAVADISELISELVEHQIMETDGAAVAE
jgi:hypothetical protein